MQEEFQTLDGTVSSVIYKNTVNGYIVLELDCSGNLETVVGTLGNIVEGERLLLKGSYSTNANYGKQFKADTCQRFLPEMPEEIEKYLASGIIKGLGPSMAKKIVAAFGKDSLSVIDKDALKLTCIKGLTPEKAIYISVEFKKLHSLQKLTEYLQTYDIKPTYAITAWYRYQDEAIKKIKENPYILYNDDIGVDFETVDRIAYENNLQQGLERVKAGIIYTIRENVYGGHTCLPYDELQKCATGYLGVKEDIYFAAEDELVAENKIKHLDIKNVTFVYLAEYYVAEKYIVDKLIAMLKPNLKNQKDYSEEISVIEWEKNITFESLQKEAIEASMNNNLFILTGKPGTGKTTTLNAVIAICKNKNLKIALTAPTGRAAKRISELTNEKAKTIHRLLVVDFSKDDKPCFMHNEKSPLDVDVVIIDEMSMVDVLLFESLLRALNQSTKLIMVGDSNQLPSVGAGNVLAELIKSKIIPCVELTEIFRQAAESLIVTNSHKIVNGIMPDLDERKRDFFFMPTSNDEAATKLIIDLAKTRLPKTYGFSSIDDIQILSPTRIGQGGTEQLNFDLQLALNPPSRQKKEIKFFKVVFRMGDKVMQIKNDYNIKWKKGSETGQGVFNGDIGIIADIDKVNNEIIIDYDGRMAVYTTEMFSKLEHAFAITIHKSQGSEYSAVIMPITSCPKQLLYRNLLYTGVTRAKKILILVGKRTAIQEMVKNNKKTRRYSCISLMLNSALQKKNKSKESLSKNKD